MIIWTREKKLKYFKDVQLLQGMEGTPKSPEQAVPSNQAVSRWWLAMREREILFGWFVRWFAAPPDIAWVSEAPIHQAVASGTSRDTDILGLSFSTTNPKPEVL